MDDPEKTSTEAPPPADAPLSETELAEAKRYGRLALAYDLIDRGIDLLYLTAAVFFVAEWLDPVLQRLAWLERFDTLRVIAMVVAVMGLHAMVSFPISFLSGYRLERAFGLSTLGVGGWLWRWCKRLVLTIGLSTVMFAGLYWIIWTTGAFWWLIAAGAFFLVSLVLGRLYPVLILPMFHTVTRLDNDDLAQRMARLVEGTGLEIEGIFQFDLSDETVKANAMLAGLGRTRRVLLGDTILANFTGREIAAIFAHEIGHHVHRHIRKMLAAGIVYSAAGFFVCDRLLVWLVRISTPTSDITDFHAQLPVAAVPAIMLLLTLFGFIVEPIQNALSRHFERQSDRYALRRTDDPEAFASAFRKLARQNKEDPDPHPLEVFLFHGHPTIRQRLAMIENAP